MKKKTLTWFQVRTQNFSVVGGGPEVIYNLRFILKIMLQKLRRNYNSDITPLATAFRLYTYKYNYTFHDLVTSLKSQDLILLFFISS